MKRRIFLTLVLLLIMVMPLMAHTCVSSDLMGNYGFVASRLVQLGVPTQPSAFVSQAHVSALLAGVSRPSAFASVGVLHFDGIGGVGVPPNGTSPYVAIGTYTLNSDCTISITASDVFASYAVNPLPAPSDVGFKGVVLDNGAQIDLIPAAAAGSGSVITLKRAFSYACSTASIYGPYVLTLAGVKVTSTNNDTSIMPAAQMWRVMADGLGNFVSNAAATAQPAGAAQATGTYTIDPDCTGSGVITNGTEQTRFSFVVVAEPAPTAQNWLAMQPRIAFVISNNGILGTGSGRLQ